MSPASDASCQKPLALSQVLPGFSMIASMFSFSSRATSDRDLPFPVYRALIESVFAGAAANWPNVLAYVAIGLYLSDHSPDVFSVACDFLLAIAGLTRIVADREAHRLFRSRSGDWLANEADVARAENGYFWVLGFFSLALGLALFAALLDNDHPADQLLLVAGSLVFNVSSPARCCGSPRSVALQSALVTLPFCAAMIVKGGASGYFAAAMGLMVLRHIRDTSQSLHGNLVSMLMARRAAEDAAEKFDTALNNMARGLEMTDNEGIIRVANRQFVEMFGLSSDPVGTSAERLVADVLAPLLQPEERPAALRDFFTGRGEASGVWRLTDGRVLSFSRERMARGSVVTVADVTAEHAARENIQRMARFDPVTNLPNRAYFAEKLAATIEAPGAPRFSLLSVDLDRFKEVNDSHGHHVGDQLLRLVAGRMRLVTGADSFVARFGGDEFMVLLGAADRLLTARIASALVRALSASFYIEGRIVRIGASVGVALFPQDAAEGDAESLLKAADMALYDAKDSGRGAVKFFVEDMALAIRRQRLLGARLREAETRGELTLAYQPVIDLVENRAMAVEALLRWTDPELGAISPAEFIPVAEETGAIVEIGGFVLRQACRDAVDWPDHIRVAVNLSAIQFERGALFETVSAALAETGLPPRRLELEITESILIGNHDLVLDMLARLHALGVHIALDDFGTGYSSLSYLNDFTFDKVKVDQSFVRDLDGKANAKSASIIRAVSAIGRDLSMTVVAEGVETEAQLALLRGLGVRGGQGYLFSRPVPAAEIALYLLKDLAGGDQPVPDEFLSRAG